jgi:hypothetical protein
MNTCDILEYTQFHRFHREYYLRNRPVIIRGIRAARPCKIFDWSREYLEHIMADTKVPVLATQTGFLSYERDVIQMPFRDFIAKSFSDPPDSTSRYYFKNPTSILPPGHDDSASIPGIGSYIHKAVLKNLWISAGRLTVGLHFDAAENFNFQLRGQKAFYLYPPGVKGYYPLPMFSQTAHISGVYRNGPNPDLAQFPLFEPSREMRVDLRDGDVLYLPAYWWHQVESLGTENINLNFWWLPSLKKQSRNWNQALRGHAQLAIRYLKLRSLLKAPPETR